MYYFHQLNNQIVSSLIQLQQVTFLLPFFFLNIFFNFHINILFALPLIDFFLVVMGDLYSSRVAVHTHTHTHNHTLVHTKKSESFFTIN